MKRLSLILVAVLFTSIATYASGGEEEATLTAKNNLKEQIFHKLDSATHDVEGEVSVFFEITENDEVILHNIIADTDELEAYVRKCMEDCHLETEDFMKGRIFEIELNFYLL